MMQRFQNSLTAVYLDIKSSLCVLINGSDASHTHVAACKVLILMIEFLETSKPRNQNT